VAFCYFETLLRIGDKQKFTVEEVRLKSMQNLLRDIGFQEHLYEDFVDETLDLLRETSVATDNAVGLLAAFNDFGRSQSVITYLKVHRPKSAMACSMLMVYDSFSQVLGFKSTQRTMFHSSRYLLVIMSSTALKLRYVRSTT
jgi:hypothetical protein